MMIRTTLTTAFLLSVVSVFTVNAQEAQTLLSYEAYSLAQAVRTPANYEPYPLTQIADEMRFPAAEPPTGTVSRHGEVEYLDHVDTNHFIQAENPALVAQRSRAAS